MKLDNETLEVLKNFSTINSNIVINVGNKLRTISEAKNILASYDSAQTFDSEFGIYDLSEFLSVYSMFDDPDLSFDEDMKYVTFKEGRRSVKYFFSDPSILTTSTKDVKMPPTDVTVTLTEDTIASMKKAAAVLRVTDAVITPDDNGNIVLTVTDSKNSTANSFEIVVGEGYEGESFSFVFAISNFKMIPDDYEVSISSKLISKFEGSNKGVEYYIALEKTSTYGG